MRYPISFSRPENYQRVNKLTVYSAKFTDATFGLNLNLEGGGKKLLGKETVDPSCINSVDLTGKTISAIEYKPESGAYTNIVFVFSFMGTVVLKCKGLKLPSESPNIISPRVPLEIYGVELETDLDDYITMITFKTRKALQKK